MLDKSVPYAGLFMRRTPGASIPAFTLPEGYKFAFFKAGDEVEWARIEAAVLEFKGEFDALMHFKQNFMPFSHQLRRRCLFIEDGTGRKVATSTAWWAHVDGERYPWLQWVGVCPEHQGKGLGKAIIAEATGLMKAIEGDVPMYLKTQTWSYKAIGIYLACGYEPTDEKALYRERKNNYKKAMKILAKIKKAKASDSWHCTLGPGQSPP